MMCAHGGFLQILEWDEDSGYWVHDGLLSNGDEAPPNLECVP